MWRPAFERAVLSMPVLRSPRYTVVSLWSPEVLGALAPAPPRAALLLLAAAVMPAAELAELGLPRDGLALPAGAQAVPKTLEMASEQQRLEPWLVVARIDIGPFRAPRWQFRRVA
jgi:hypothetical protein